MRKFSVVVVVVAALVDTAAGHKCADGSRVQCTAIQQVAGGPANGGPSVQSGKGAKGWLTCSESGQRVFCLFNHDYHKCAPSHEACCTDGSSPSHNGNYNGDEENLDCSRAVAAKTVNEVSSVSQLPQDEKTAPIVLDDLDVGAVAAMENVFAGTYQPCMKDAYQQQMHHDWARNKGAASLTFKFTPPSSGCYTVEEYHPGNAWECSRYLPSNARLDIDSAPGLSKTLYIDQTKNPAKWNEIASLMFAEGVEGKLTMRSDPAEQCELQGQCFLVVDAFRLTWKGKECPAASAIEDQVIKELNAPVDPSAPGVVAPNQQDAAVYNTCGRKGLLSLRVTMAHGQDLASVEVMVHNHKTIFETTLAAHLGHKSVSILDVVASVASDRRLHGDESPHAAVSLSVRFKAQGQMGKPTTDALLMQSLQSNLDSIVPGMKLESAKVEMLKPDPYNDDSNANVTLYVVLASASFFLLGIAVFFVWRYLKVLSAPQGDTRSVNADQANHDFVNVKSSQVETVKDSSDDLEKAKEVEQADNASTGTPSSEPPQVSDDGTGSEGNSIEAAPAPKTDWEVAI